MTFRRYLQQTMTVADDLLTSLDFDGLTNRAEIVAGEIGSRAAMEGYPALYESSWRVRLPCELKHYLATCLAATRPAELESDWLTPSQVADA